MSPPPLDRRSRPTAPAAQCRCCSTPRHSREPSATKPRAPARRQVYQLPGTGNEDVPQDATQFNWTIFCTASGNPCNANSSDVDALINGHGANTVVYLDDDIGPLNAGTHNTLFDELFDNAIGDLFPVPVVDDEGLMVGWGYFRLLSAEGSSDKVITGYFVSPVNGEELVVNGGHKSGTLFTGAYSVRLTN